MNKDELLDLVNENNEVIGTVKRSDTEGNMNLIHREIDLFVFNSKGETLVQQRSLTKKVNPGLWVNAAAGHIGSGEDPNETVVREAEEELGIIVNPILHKIYLDRDHQSQESRFFYAYYAVYDKDDISVDPSEVADYKWLKVDELEGKIDKDCYDLTIEIYSAHF